MSFFFSLSCSVRATPCSACLDCRSSRTRCVNSRSTLTHVLADVSRNSQPKWRASCAPSSLETSRSYCLSHLLPTSMNTAFSRLTFSIACRKTSTRSKVARDAIEYARMKPSPSLNARVRYCDLWRQVGLLTSPIDLAM